MNFKTLFKSGSVALSGNAFSNVSRAFDKQEEAKGKLIALDAAADKIQAGNDSLAKAIKSRQTRLTYHHNELDSLLSLL